MSLPIIILLCFLSASNWI